MKRWWLPAVEGVVVTAIGVGAGGSIAPWCFNAAAIIAMGTAGFALHRTRGRARSSLALVWAGLALWVIGDLAWSAYEHVHGVAPSLSAIDAVYLAGYPLIALGVLRLLRDHGEEARAGILDGAALAAASTVCIWSLLGQTTSGAGDGAVSVVTVSYPLADVLLVAAVLWLALTGSARRPATQWLIAGLSATLAVDLTFALTRTSTGWIVTAVDAAYAISYGILGVAFTHPSAATAASPPTRAATRMHPARLVALGIALFLAPLTAALGGRDASFRDRIFLIVITAVTAGVVFARFTLAVRGEERARAEVARRANHDELTGLLNRQALLAQIREAVETARRATLLYLDLDGLKRVNDTAGHAAGDAILIEAAACLLRATGGNDLVGRLGGDEFAALCIDQPGQVRTAAARVLAEFRQNAFLVSRHITASIGAARLAADETTTLLVARADAAMYTAKRSGGDRFVELSPAQ